MAVGCELQLQRMSVAKSAVFFIVLKFWVAALRAVSFVCNVVVGPLVHDRERMCVSKENFVIFFGGRSLRDVTCGRAKPVKTRTFDNTLGFPGEDVALQPP